MADAITGKSNIDAVAQEIVSRNVQQFLMQEAKLLPTVSNYSSLALPGVDKIKIPKQSALTVMTKAAGTAVDAQAVTYTTDDLALDTHQVIQVLAEKIANIQANVDMLGNLAEQAGRSMGLALDVSIITALQNTSASAPDHRINYSAASGAGPLSEADVIEARRLLNVANVPDDGRRIFLLGPNEEAAALAIPGFVRADQSGSPQTLITGAIGTRYGFLFVVHNSMTGCVAYHPSHVAVAIQQGVTYETESALAHLSTRHSFDQLYGVKTLDGGKRGVTISAV